MNPLRQYRTIGVCGLRRQVFRQMKQKTQGILCVFPRLFVKYAGKDASKTCASYLCGVALRDSSLTRYHEKTGNIAADNHSIHRTVRLSVHRKGHEARSGRIRRQLVRRRKKRGKPQGHNQRQNRPNSRRRPRLGGGLMPLSNLRHPNELQISMRYCDYPVPPAEINLSYIPNQQRSRKHI